jgi:hypothetical protein
VLELEKSNIRIRGVLTNGAAATAKYKLRNNSRLDIEDFYFSNTITDEWQSFFDYDASSYAILNRVSGLLGLSTYKLNASSNLRINNFIDQSRVNSPFAGSSAVWKPHYRSGQNLLINPSFEAGMYSWALDTGDVPTFVQSEVGQGLMFQCTSTTGFALTQGILISASQLNQPITLTYVVKMVGNGFIYPVNSSYYATGENRVYAGNGWCTVTHTFRPQSTSASPLMFGLATSGVGGVSTTIYVDEMSVCFGDEGVINTSKFGSFDLNQKTFTSATAAPTTGTWKVGDRVFNSNPSVGQPKGWICTVAGSPGTWVSEGNL